MEWVRIEFVQLLKRSTDREDQETKRRRGGRPDAMRGFRGLLPKEQRLTLWRKTRRQGSLSDATAVVEGVRPDVEESGNFWSEYYC